MTTGSEVARMGAGEGEGVRPVEVGREGFE